MWFKVDDNLLLPTNKLARFPNADWGRWLKLMALSSKSPKRGFLLINEDFPMNIDDIARVFGDTPEDTYAILKIFKVIRFLQFSERNGKILGAIQILNWKEYQGSSAPDSVNLRVKRHREKLKCNEDVTSLKRQSNAVEIEIDKDIISAKADYKKTSDRVKYELDKTFRGKKGVSMGLAMKIVKDKGEDLVVKALGRIREYYEKGKTIEDPPSYFISICNNL